MRFIVASVCVAMSCLGCITGGSGSPSDQQPMPISVSLDVQRGWGIPQIVAGVGESGAFEAVQSSSSDLVLRLTQPQLRYEEGEWAPLQMACLMTIVGIVAGPCFMASVVNEYTVDVVHRGRSISSFPVEASLVSWNTIWNRPPEDRLLPELGREIGLTLAEELSRRWPTISGRLAEPIPERKSTPAGLARSELVVAIQRKLASLDYYSGEANGLMDPGTQTAIRAFQRHHRLPIDGQASPALLQNLAFAYTLDSRPNASLREASQRPTPSYSGSDTRVALVVGNASYSGAARLTNPSRDASAIADLLTALGFETELVLDANADGLRRALRNFGGATHAADIALFYYAGHAVQVGGVNHLVPIGASLATERDLSYDAIPLDLVTAELARFATSQIVILDACRDNPFASRLASSARKTRSASVTRGLAVTTRESVGTLIAYATAPNRVAADGTGQHSPYTDALLRWLPEPGLEISEVFRLVRNDVIAATNRQQVPWENSSLVGNGIYLGGP